jgi:hypothetical protein
MPCRAAGSQNPYIKILNYFKNGKWDIDKKDEEASIFLADEASKMQICALYKVGGHK